MKEKQQQLICTDEIIFPVMHALGFCRNSEEFLYTESCYSLPVPTKQGYHSTLKVSDIVTSEHVCRVLLETLFLL